MKLSLRHLPVRFLRHREGATIIEFAIVAPIFFLLILGIIEFGLILFSSVAIESIVMMASRTASLGATSNAAMPACNGSATTADFIKCYVKQRGAGLINGGAISVVAVPYTGGAPAAPVLPDVCLDSGTPSSAPDTCTQYMEVNSIPHYQGQNDPLVTQSNAGTGGQLVQITAYYPWKVMIPFVSQYFGCHDTQNTPGCAPGVIMITSSTIVKNEPF
ncbi:MAG: TadE/TadG family type IV pilus assembly protein [Alphaproteobacteria bacterium]